MIVKNTIKTIAEGISFEAKEVELLSDRVKLGATVVYVMRRSSRFNFSLLVEVCKKFGFPVPENESEVLFLRNRTGHEMFLAWVRAYRLRLLERGSRLLAGREVVFVPISFFAGRGPEPFPKKSLLPIDFKYFPILDLWDALVFYVHRKATFGRLTVIDLIKPSNRRAPASDLLRRMSKELYQQEKRARGVASSKSETVELVVLSDERLERGVSEIAEQTNASREQLYEGAKRRLKEIAATMNGRAVRVIYSAVKPVMSRVFQKIDVHGIEHIQECAGKYPTVLLPSHKSHFDYLLVGWILYHSNLPMPYVAAGINLNFFPVGNFFKSAGAFFIRRSIGDDTLYKLVLDSYLSYLIKRGHLLTFYIEGGRSRSGALRSPRLGLLKYLVQGWLAGGRDDIRFVPIGISYEKLAEERSLVRERRGDAKEKESLFQLLRLKGIWKKTFGEASFSVGEPFSLKEFVSRTQNTDIEHVDINLLTEDLAFAVSRGIRQQTALTASALASVSISTLPGECFSQSKAVDRMTLLFKLFEETSSHIGFQLREILRSDELKLGLSEAFSRFAETGYLESNGDSYCLQTDQRLAVDYYKNNILYAYVPYAIIAAVLKSGSGVNLEEGVHRYHQLLKPVFLFEHWRFWKESLKVHQEVCKGRQWVTESSSGFLSLTEKGKSELVPLTLLLRPYWESLLACCLVVGGSDAFDEKSEKVLRESTKLKLAEMDHLDKLPLPESSAASYLEFSSATVVSEIREKGLNSISSLTQFLEFELHCLFKIENE